MGFALFFEKGGGLKTIQWNPDFFYPTWKRQFGSSYWEVKKIEGKIMHKCLTFEGKLHLVMVEALISRHPRGTEKVSKSKNWS